jgi:hypothetical protein
MQGQVGIVEDRESCQHRFRIIYAAKTVSPILLESWIAQKVSIHSRENMEGTQDIFIYKALIPLLFRSNGAQRCCLTRKFKHSFGMCIV